MTGVQTCALPISEDEKQFRLQLLRGDVHDPGAAMFGGVAGHAGLFSNAYDLAMIMQMLLNGGNFNGKNYLSKHSVELLTSNHTGELKGAWAPGMGMGLGFQVVRNVEGMFRLQSIGTYTHGGAWQTYYFVDPKKELIGLIMMQRQGGGGDTSDEFNAFISMACAAVN